MQIKYFLMSLVSIFLLATCNKAKFNSSKQITEIPVEPKTFIEEPEVEEPIDKEKLPKCEDLGQKAISPDVLIIVDTSGSNRDTDCPGKQILNGIEVCSQTMRENALYAAIDRYKQFSSDNGLDQVSAPRIAIGHFPNKSNSSNTLLNWQSIVADYEVPDSFKELLKDVARKPEGATPIDQGIDLANLEFNRLPALNSIEERKKVVVFIGDGMVNPRVAFSELDQKVAQFKDLGLESYFLINQNNQTSEEVLAKHRSSMRGIFQNNEPWSSEYTYSEYQNNLEQILGEYLTKTVGGYDVQGQKVSNGTMDELVTSDRQYTIDSNSQIPEKLLNNILPKTVDCE